VQVDFSKPEAVETLLVGKPTLSNGTIIAKYSVKNGKSFNSIFK